MINNELLVFIRRQLGANVSKEKITADLRSVGWTDSDINEGFSALSPKPAASPASAPEAPASSPVINPSPMEPVTQFRPVNTYTAPVSGPAVHQSGKRKKIIIGLVAILILILGGAVGYAYQSGVFVSLPKVISQATSNAQEAKSAEFDITTSLHFPEIGMTMGFGSKKVDLTFEGSYDHSDTENLKNQTVISFNSDGLSFSGELRMVDKVLYVALAEATLIPLLPDFSQYENKWFSFENSDSFGALISNQVPVWGASQAVLEKLTTDQKAHLNELLRNASLIRVIKKLPSEVITGESTHHFSFEPDRGGMESYLLSLKNYVNEIGKEDSFLSSFDPTAMADGLENLEDFQGEMWIGKNDKLPHKIALSFAIKVPTPSLGTLPEEESGPQIKMSFVAVFSNWNKPPDISAPEESTPLPDLMSLILGGSLTNAQQKGGDAAVKSSLSNLRAQAELFYDSNSPMSYKGLCTSPSVVSTKKTIEESGGTRFECNENGQAYFMSARLVSGSGDWCIDSAGSSKGIKSSELTIPRAYTACPMQ